MNCALRPTLSLQKSLNELVGSYFGPQPAALDPALSSGVRPLELLPLCVGGWLDPYRLSEPLGIRSGPCEVTGQCRESGTQRTGSAS